MKKLEIKQEWYRPSYWIKKRKTIATVEDRAITYINEFMNMLLSMFKYDIDIDQNPYFDFTELERYLITDGQAAIANTDDGLVIGRFSFAGSELDYNGRQKRAYCICKNGAQFEGEIGKDIIWVWNNLNRTNEKDNMIYFSDMMSELDLSLIFNIKYSRNCPIPVARNEQMRKSISEAIKSIFTGKDLQPMLADTMTIGEIRGTTTASKPYDVVNFTDVNTSDKIQNLTMLRDFIISSMSRIYGISFTGNGKKAQQNETELAAYSQFSSIVPLTRLDRRIKMCEEIKKAFDVDITVDFNPLLKVYTNQEEEAAKEDINEDGTVGGGPNEIKEDSKDNA